MPENKQETHEHHEHVVVVDKHGKRRHMVMVEPDDLVREQARGFLHFLRDYAVVGLAVGFIIGQQAQFLIKQLIDSFVTPLQNVLIGESVQNRSFAISSGDHSGEVTWGKFVYVLFNFIFVMIFIYVLVKLMKLDKLKDVDKKKKK
jgi:large-conductance mechanosensitive channel